MRLLFLAVILAFTGCKRPALQHVSIKETLPILTALSYADPEPTYKRGVAIAPNVPTLTGGEASLFIVAPKLPAGLELDPVTGVISGTPSSVTEKRTSNIIASNDLGSVSVEIAISVVDDPPLSLAYDEPEMRVARGDRLEDNHAHTTGGVPERFTVTPELPNGVQMDRLTGLLFGFPTTVQPRTMYTIAAENAFGPPVTTTVAIEVTIEPPALVFGGSPYEAVVGEAFSTGRPTNTGAPIEGCVAETPLPPGLTINTTSCEIAGVPNVVLANTTCAVLATNAGGTRRFELQMSIHEGLAIDPQSITITAASFETDTFTASGGIPPYSFRIVSGPGIIDSETGTYAPDGRAGPSVVEARDARGHVAVATVANRSMLVVGGLVNASVYAKGSVYVGGQFDTIVPQIGSSIIAVSPVDLGIQRGFDVGDGFDERATALLAVGDSIYVGGRFSSYRGRIAPHLAKIDARTGRVDETFTQAIGFNDRLATAAATDIFALAADATYLYVGGNFDSYRNVPVQHFLRVRLDNGELDSTFPSSLLVFNNAVRAIAIHGGDVWVGGSFTDLGGLTVNDAALVRLTTTGTFIGGYQANGAVRSFSKVGNALYASGDFTSLSPSATINRSYAVKLDLDAAGVSGIDPSFVPVLVAAAPSISATSQRVYVASGLTVKALLPTTGADDPSFLNTPGFDVAPVSVFADASGGVIASGGFRTWNGQAAERMAFVKGDGALNAALQKPRTLASGYAPPTHDTAIGEVDGRLVIVGNFRAWGGLVAKNLAKFDASTGRPDPDFLVHGRTEGEVSALAFSNDRLYVGGLYTHYDGVACRSLARITMDGQRDIGPGAIPCGVFSGASDVRSILVSNGTVLAGGAFATYNAAAQVNLVSISEVTGQRTTAIGATGVSGLVVRTLINGPAEVSSVPLGPTIFVGGFFSHVLGVASANLGRIKMPSGLPASAYGTVTGGNTTSVVQALAFVPAPTNLLFVGFLGSTAPHGIRLATQDGTGYVTAGSLEGYLGEGSVAALATNNEDVWMAGDFDYFLATASSPPFMSSGALRSLASNPVTPRDTFHAGAKATGSNARTLTLSGAELWLGGGGSSYFGEATGTLVVIDAATGALLR